MDGHTAGLYDRHLLAADADSGAAEPRTVTKEEANQLIKENIPHDVHSFYRITDPATGESKLVYLVSNNDDCDSGAVYDAATGQRIQEIDGINDGGCIGYIQSHESVSRTDAVVELGYV